MIDAHNLSLMVILDPRLRHSRTRSVRAPDREASEHQSRVNSQNTPSIIRRVGRFESKIWDIMMSESV